MKMSLSIRVRSSIALLLCALSSGNARGDSSPDLIKLFQELPAFSSWKLVQSVQLPGQSYHPQGMVKLGSTLYMSTVDSGGQRGFLIQYEIKTDPSGKIQASETRRIELVEGDRYHAGGLDWDSRLKKIWLPLAEYKSNSSASIYQVDPANLRATKVADISDHVGTVIAESARRMLRMVNWDIGIYSAPMDADGQISSDLSNVPLVNPPDGGEYGGVEYQDCKSISDGYAYCSSTHGSIRAKGTVDLIRFDSPSTASGGSAPYRVIHRVPVPAVDSDGKVISQGWFDPTLSQNPFFAEEIATKDGVHLRLYFVPHDGPKSHLLIYDAP